MNSVLAPSALEDLSPFGLQRSRTGLRPSPAGISNLLLHHAEVLGVSRAPKHVLTARSTRADGGKRDLHAGSHRRADGNLLQIMPLRARRLRLDDAVYERLHVRDDRVFRETRLADAGLNDAGFLDAVLDRATLRIFHRR